MTMTMAMNIQSVNPPFIGQCCRWVRNRTHATLEPACHGAGWLPGAHRLRWRWDGTLTLKTRWPVFWSQVSMQPTGKTELKLVQFGTGSGPSQQVEGMELGSRLGYGICLVR